MTGPLHAVSGSFCFTLFLFYGKVYSKEETREECKNDLYSTGSALRL